MISRVTGRMNLAVPNTVIGNPDAQVKNLLEIANEEGEDLATRSQWTAMETEVTQTMLIASSQGTLDGTVITAGDFDYYLRDTMWNRTNAQPITGELDSQERQRRAAFPVTGPYPNFYIRGGILYFDPAPTTADTFAFEYMSTSWCEDNGGTGQSEWLNDSDVGRLSERVMTLGIRWRWRKSKGLSYSEDFATYERAVADTSNRDRPATVENLGGRPLNNKLAGIVIPIGNWNQ